MGGCGGFHGGHVALGLHNDCRKVKRCRLDITCVLKKNEFYFTQKLDIYGFLWIISLKLAFQLTQLEIQNDFA